MNLIITETAANKIASIIREEDNPALKLRIFIEGGGCSGFNYGFTLDEVMNEDDFAITSGSTSVLVDAMSAQYLEGAEIDYKETLAGSSFVFSNPMAKSTCGCGSSFTPH
jgi:iron-sulfur cluster insertion protein